MMQPFLLTVAAHQDLANIGRFTIGRWGRQQRNAYLKQLDDAFRLLSSQPDMGRDASSIKPGYKKHSVGSHVIFYRAGTESIIVVVRVLHSSMDFEQHL